jgi:transposase, IS5 family
MIKKKIPGSFVSVEVSRSTSKSRFFDQINALIAWTVLEKALYQVCQRSMADAAGRPAYNPLVLFKIMLLPTWYHLSDMGVEDMVHAT